MRHHNRLVNSGCWRVIRKPLEIGAYLATTGTGGRVPGTAKPGTRLRSECHAPGGRGGWSGWRYHFQRRRHSSQLQFMICTTTVSADLHDFLPSQKKMSKTVNYLRKDFKPSYISMRDKNGRLVSLKKRAETIAAYLEEQHWCNDCGRGPLPQQQNIGDTLVCDSTPFTLAELKDVLKHCTVNKQPGPDCIVAELYK